jgi:hypothetical protein
MEGRRDWTVILVSVTGVALAAVVGTVALHEACFDPIGGQPGTGTPRGSYCEAVDPTHPWLTLMVLPILVIVGVNLAFPTRKRLVYAFAVLLAIALVVNAAVVSGLDAGFGGV